MSPVTKTGAPQATMFGEIPSGGIDPALKKGEAPVPPNPAGWKGTEFNVVAHGQTFNDLIADMRQKSVKGIDEKSTIKLGEDAGTQEQRDAGEAKAKGLFSAKHGAANFTTKAEYAQVTIQGRPMVLAVLTGQPAEKKPMEGSNVFANAWSKVSSTFSSAIDAAKAPPLTAVIVDPKGNVVAELTERNGTWKPSSLGLAEVAAMYSTPSSDNSPDHQASLDKAVEVATNLPRGGKPAAAITVAEVKSEKQIPSNYDLAQLALSGDDDEIYKYKQYKKQLAASDNPADQQRALGLDKEIEAGLAALKNESAKLYKSAMEGLKGDDDLRAIYEKFAAQESAPKKKKVPSTATSTTPSTATSTTPSTATSTTPSTATNTTPSTATNTDNGKKTYESLTSDLKTLLSTDQKWGEMPAGDREQVNKMAGNVAFQYRDELKKMFENKNQGPELAYEMFRKRLAERLDGFNASSPDKIAELSEALKAGTILIGGNAIRMRALDNQ